VRWISRKEFESWDFARHLDLDVWCYFQISEKELREKIGNWDPEQDLLGEDDPSGPVSRW